MWHNHDLIINIDESMTTISSLSIDNLSLSIHLGWTDAEQSKKQRVTLNLTIHLPKPPTACRTDKLDDTYCYDDLIKQIQVHCKNKKYRLIEYLCADIYNLIKPKLPKRSRVVTTIIKQPKIAGFSGTTSFTYGDK